MLVIGVETVKKKKRKSQRGSDEWEGHSALQIKEKCIITLMGDCLEKAPWGSMWSYKMIDTTITLRQKAAVSGRWFLRKGQD